MVSISGLSGGALAFQGPPAGGRNHVSQRTLLEVLVSDGGQALPCGCALFANDPATQVTKVSSDRNASQIKLCARGLVGTHAPVPSSSSDSASC